MSTRSLRVLLATLLVVGQVALLVALLLAHDRGELHDVEVGIVAPGLVGTLVVGLTASCACDCRDRGRALQTVQRGRRSRP